MAVDKNILCVDDEPDIVRIVKFRLEHAGYSVKAAETGRKALDLVRQKPDLVLLDIVLPDIDGFSICAKIKAEPDLASIPVVFFTAQGADLAELRKKIREIGGSGFIFKPFSGEVLLKKVSEFL